HLPPVTDRRCAGRFRQYVAGRGRVVPPGDHRNRAGGGCLRERPRRAPGNRGHDPDLRTGVPHQPAAAGPPARSDEPLIPMGTVMRNSNGRTTSSAGYGLAAAVAIGWVFIAPTYWIFTVTAALLIALSTLGLAVVGWAGEVSLAQAGLTGM